MKLRLEQQFKCPQQDTRVVQLEDYMAPKGVPSGALFCFEQGSNHCAHPKSPSRDWRPHVELAIHWSLANVQRVMALVDSGAECSLTYGKLEQFLGPGAHTDGHSGQMITSHNGCVLCCRFRTMYCKGCVIRFRKV